MIVRIQGNITTTTLLRLIKSRREWHYVLLIHQTLYLIAYSIVMNWIWVSLNDLNCLVISVLLIMP